MDVNSLSQLNRDLLIEAMLAGQVVNALYRNGERLEGGFSRERRCFALGERGWLDFVGWEGAKTAGAELRARWALTAEALRALGQRLA